MRTAIIAFSVALSLTGCAKFQQAYDAATSAKVPPKAIIVAANAFNAVKATATNYIRYCTPNPAPVGCDNKVIKGKLIPAMNAGTVARNSLEDFLITHPGELGPKGVYDVLVSSTTTIQAVVSTYRN